MWMIKLCLAFSVLLCLGESYFVKKRFANFDELGDTDLDDSVGRLPIEDLFMSKDSFNEAINTAENLENDVENEGNFNLGEKADATADSLGESEDLEGLRSTDPLKEQTLPYPNLPRITAAFYATAKPNIQDNYPYSTVSFSNVVTNIGGSYNKSSGEFKALADGKYIFYYNILSVDKLETALQVNGQTKLLLYSDVLSSSSNTAYGSVGNRIVLPLYAGDVVKMVIFTSTPPAYEYFYPENQPQNGNNNNLDSFTDNTDSFTDNTNSNNFNNYNKP